MANIVKKAKNKDNPYAQIDKEMLNNPEISLKAKGLLSLLLSKPDDWETNIKNLVNTSLDGWDSVKSGLRELENYGYVIRNKIRDKGVIVGTVTLVYDEPQHLPIKPIIKKEYKIKEQPGEDNPSEVDLQGFEPEEDKPSEGKPLEGNPPYTKNDIIKTESNKIISDLMEFDTIDSLAQYYSCQYNLPELRVMTVYDRVVNQYIEGKVKQFKPYFEASLAKEKADYELDKFITVLNAF